MKISLGVVIKKPIETQEQCDDYYTISQGVNKHNLNINSGDYYWQIEDKGDYYEVVQGDQSLTEDTVLKQQKEIKITESKEFLSEYLSTHPILWSDGKYYSVTSEKQSLLTSNLALYQLSTGTDVPFNLTWNSTGDECVEWEYKDLVALALTIGAYVKPYVSHQQELELAIKACKTLADLEAIEISYDLVEGVSE